MFHRHLLDETKNIYILRLSCEADIYFIKITVKALKEILLIYPETMSGSICVRRGGVQFTNSSVEHVAVDPLKDLIVLGASLSGGHRLCNEPRGRNTRRLIQFQGLWK